MSDRPDTEPTHHGEFESERVYLRGDTATWEGETWRAVADFRSGFLPPPLVAADHPGRFWELVA